MKQSASQERFARLRSILLVALELDGPDRSSYLDKACSGDRGLRAEAESLLRSTSETNDIDLTIDRGLAGWTPDSEEECLSKLVPTGEKYPWSD